jgi:hypothetical protein
MIKGARIAISHALNESLAPRAKASLCLAWVRITAEYGTKKSWRASAPRGVTA